MRYVVLIHSNPDPWGHPTAAFTDEGRAQPPEYHERADREFDELLDEISASGELVSGAALGDPATSVVYGWSPQGAIVTDGPYAEAKEQLAGFFVLDCADPHRARELGAHFAGPGSTVELRPVMSAGADD